MEGLREAGWEPLLGTRLAAWKESVEKIIIEMPTRICGDAMMVDLVIVTAGTQVV